jgi:hypothetical protein
MIRLMSMQAHDALRIARITDPVFVEDRAAVVRAISSAPEPASHAPR